MKSFIFSLKNQKVLGALLHSSFTSIHLQFLPLQLLLRNFFLFWFRSRRFGKSLLFFNQTHFNVAWRRHVWIDTTMSPISSSAHFRCAVHLNMIDDQMIGIQTLVFGIGFGVFQQVQQEFGGFLRPSTLGSSMNFGLGMTTNTTHESTKGNNFLLFDDVFQVSGSMMKRHLLNGLSRFSGVLEGLQDDLLKYLGGLRTIITKWPPFNSSKQSPSFF